MARWQRINSRGRVDDRRGISSPGLAIGGLGGIGVIIVLLVTLLGGGSGLDQILGQLENVQAPQQPGAQPEEFQGQDDYEVFASTVLGSTDETWGAIFESSGLTYALDGGMQRIADKVFLLTPRNVEVSAEERARLIEKGFFNQS
jgi:predicted metalloprotease